MKNRFKSSNVQGSRWERTLNLWTLEPLNVSQMNRRRFIRLLSRSLAAAALLPRASFAADAKDKRAIQFVFAQVKYRGGEWNPHPLAVTPLLEELMLRTSVEAATAKREVNLTDRDLFNTPFLYM